MTVPEGATFEWRGRRLTYETGGYNRAAENERAVEVPIARQFILDNIQAATGDTLEQGLEVGNVLRHYIPVGSPWRVVDLHEEAPGVENLDVFDIQGEYPWIVAISTLEHVTTRGPLSPIEAVRHLLDLLAPGGRLLLTVPMGQNPHLDGAVYACGLEVDHRTLTHEASLTFEGDHWAVHEGERLWGPLRDHSWPSVVWVGEFHR